MAQLTVEDAMALGITAGPPPEPYERDEWFTGWADADGDCQNTRHEVLLRDADGPVTLSSDGCRVISGQWNDPYTGIEFTDPSDLDIDHVVPLSNAHQSGGWAWTAARRGAFANDLGGLELLAVDDASNSAKGDRSPDEWLPANPAYQCTYAVDWITIKTTWGLTVSDSERQQLLQVLQGC